jgi:hypothetical protein
VKETVSSEYSWVSANEKAAIRDWDSDNDPCAPFNKHARETEKRRGREGARSRESSKMAWN